MDDYHFVHTTNSNHTTKAEKELLQMNAGATPIDEFPTICLHTRVCDGHTNTFGPEDAAKLDAVLASVNRLIECLELEFKDACCHHTHGIAIETKQENLIRELETSQISKSLPSSKNDHLAGASKQHDFVTADNTTPRGNHNVEATEASWKQSRESTKENNKFFTQVDMPLLKREETFDNFYEEAEISSKRCSSKEKNEIRSHAFQEKQITMTLSQLKCPQDTIELPSPGLTPFHNELTCEKKFRSSVEFFIKGNSTETTDHLVQAENDKATCEFSKRKYKVCTEHSQVIASEESPTIRIRDSVDSGTFSIDIDTTAPQQKPEKDQPNCCKGKERRKIRIVTKLPSRVASYKDQQIAAIKAFLPKRKISRGKESAELKSLSSTSSTCSCGHQQSRNRKKGSLELLASDITNFVFDRQPNKSQKPEGRKKTFLNKQKRFALRFRRSQSFDDKNSTDSDSDCSTATDDGLFFDSGKKRKLPTEGKLKKNRTFCGNPTINPILVESNNEKSFDQMRLNMKSSHFHEDTMSRFGSPDNRPPAKLITTNGGMESRDGVSAYHEKRKQNRNSSGTSFTYLDCSEFALTESTTQRKSSTEQITSSPLVQVWVPIGSESCLRASQDSSEENDTYRQSPSVLLDHNGLESVAKLADKLGAKKNRLRKTIKKSSSMPTYDADEIAERTWAPTGDYTWGNLSGKKVELGTTRLQSLSELECDALQKVSLERLQEAELGAIIVPKDESKVQHRKMSMKKKYLSSKDKNKDKNYDHVFGIPLVNVVENDQLLRLQKSASFDTAVNYQTPDPANELGSHTTTGFSLSSSSSCSGSSSSIHNHHLGNASDDREVEGSKTASFENASSDECVHSPEVIDGDNVFANMNGMDAGSPHQVHTPTSAKSIAPAASQPLRRRGAIAANSLNEIDHDQSQLLEALSLTVSGAATNQRKEKKEKKRSLLPSTMPSVPYVVQKCCDHIKKYGLDVTGIFRIAGSKKRVKQLREEFDRGMDVTIDEDFNPHDVAALLKEFFRDLPEALLTRDLYSAFIQTAKLSKHERISCLRYLVWLLPLPNRDTLHTLLNFLAIVATHSETSLDRAGNKVMGNKMTVRNLATIFGPNIMHRYKKSQSGNDNQYQGQNLEKPEESTAVIKIVDDLITNQIQLFQIPKEEHNEMIRTLKETDPEAVDFLLRRKAAKHMRGKSTSPHSPRKLSPLVIDGSSECNINVATSPFAERVNEHAVKQRYSVVTPERKNEKENHRPQSISAPRTILQKASRQAQIPTHNTQDKSYDSSLEKSNLQRLERGLKDETPVKPSSLKFKTPILNQLKQPKLDTDWSETDYQSNNSNGLVENASNGNEIISGEEIVDESTRESTSSAISTFAIDQSVSFTEDDLLQILGKKCETAVPMIQEFRCTDECCDNTKNVHDRKKAVEVMGEELELAECTANKLYYLGKNAAARSHSSDSTTTTDSAKDAPVSPDEDKRTYGFTFSPHSLLNKGNYQSKSISNGYVSTPDIHKSWQNYYKNRKSLIIKDNVVKSTTENTDNGAHCKTYYAFVENPARNELPPLHPKPRKTLHKLNTDMTTAASNNHSNSENISHTETNDDNKALYLRPSTVSTMNAVLSPSTQLSPSNAVKQNPSNLKEARSISFPEEQYRPKPLPRKRLQKSLSSSNCHEDPVVLSQTESAVQNTPTAFSKEQIHIQTRKTVSNKSNDETENQADWNVIRPRPRKQTVVDCATREETDTEICDVNSLSNHNLESKNVSALVRRYSKDDLALTSDLKQVSGSRWTSSGLIGNADANFSIYPQHSIRCSSVRECKRINHVAGGGHLTWHAIGDRHLPETLV